VELARGYHEKHQKFGAKVNPAVGRRRTVGSSSFFFALESGPARVPEKSGLETWWMNAGPIARKEA